MLYKIFTLLCNPSILISQRVDVKGAWVLTSSYCFGSSDSVLTELKTTHFFLKRPFSDPSHTQKGHGVISLRHSCSKKTIKVQDWRNTPASNMLTTQAWGPEFYLESGMSLEPQCWGAAEIQGLLANPAYQASPRLNERPCLKTKVGSVWRKTTPKVDLWPPHMQVYTHTNIHKHTYVHTHKCACTHASLHAQTYINTHVRTCVFMHTIMCLHTYT